MKRSEIWTAASGSGYGTKPRPVVIIQDDQYSRTESVTVCPITSDQTGAVFLRPSITPNSANGLEQESYLMIDKIYTLKRDRLGKPLGSLSAQDMGRLERSMAVFLGLAR